jgi:PAS domain-containing protein
VALRVVSEPRNGRAMLHGILLDITDRRAIEIELQRQQERLAVATRAAGMGIWERDVQGRAVF